MRMTGTVRLYHGSKAGLSGAIAPLSRNACDFGRGFYRFWHFKTGESSAEIYLQADADRVLGCYSGYHTISNDLAVENLKVRMI